jgi:hypothetical protein
LTHSARNIKYWTLFSNLFIYLEYWVKLGIFLILRCNLNGFWGFYHGTIVGTSSPKAFLFTIEKLEQVGFNGGNFIILDLNFPEILKKNLIANYFYICFHNCPLSLRSCSHLDQLCNCVHTWASSIGDSSM